MKSVKSFLFANLPLSIVHFILFVVLFDWLGHPGFWVAGILGATGGGILWWAIMVLNSLFWGGAITLVILPFLRKLFR